MKLLEKKELALFLTHDNENVREFSKRMLEKGVTSCEVYLLNSNPRINPVGIQIQFNNQKHYLVFINQFISRFDPSIQQDYYTRFFEKEPENIKTYATVTDLMNFLEHKDDSYLKYKK